LRLKKFFKHVASSRNLPSQVFTNYKAMGWFCRDDQASMFKSILQQQLRSQNKIVITKNDTTTNVSKHYSTLIHSELKCCLKIDLWFATSAKQGQPNQ